MAATEQNENSSTTSAEEDNQSADEFLPFQTLSVELEEGEGHVSTEGAIMIADNETSFDTKKTDISNEEGDLSSSVIEDTKVSTPNDTREHSFFDGDDAARSTPGEFNEKGAVEFDSSYFLEQELHDSESEPAQSYLEDFLFVEGSSNAPDSDSTGNDDKGIPLNRFPMIVRAVETSDYGILQDLYRLLYLRNAWDTEKILAQRILEFSGFTCAHGSEDFFNRQLMLRMMPNETLVKIGNILSMTLPRSFDVSNEKTKMELVAKIMNFLHKPKKRTRAPRRSLLHTKKPQENQQSKSLPPSRGSTTGRRGRRQASKSMKPDPPVVSESTSSVEIAELDSSSTTSSISEKPVASNNNQEADLCKLDADSSRVIADASKPSGKLLCVTLTDIMKSKKHDLYKAAKLNKKEAGDNKGDSMSSEVKVVNHVEMAEVKTDEKDIQKKLKDFSLVASSIEGTPVELLEELHFVMYFEKHEKFKQQILEFEKFPFSPDSEEYEKRKDHLKMLSELTVKNLVRSLYIDPKSDIDATILLLLKFLEKPEESFLKPANISSGLLSDCDFDLDSLSDSGSDDSIIQEEVPKKGVEVIDLISSGDDSDDEKQKEDLKLNEKPPLTLKTSNAMAVPLVVAPRQTFSSVPSHLPPKPLISSIFSATEINIPQETKRSLKRTLRDFQTITKIVNTHPTEYLVDIYNLLYMRNYELSTLRSEILDFSGFEFDKVSSEYVKRRQFLDRMLYNSVRRIYNTLIHNTREVKVFSKPTMIIEIFQFLFKLPDTDTSIRLPLSVSPIPSSPSIAPASPTPAISETLNASVHRGLSSLLSSPGKLSELRRVFQRVACFPCEYLIDVHKLLFMTDCPMKDIRAKIFGFKGFSFSVDSPEFNKRKMYLEYLTFHSLRKISSVLTTKTVDLRNSTKHELASHLTEVLKEYTTLNFDDESDTIGEEIPTTIEEIRQICPADTAVEEIVVTPIIEPLESPPPSPSEPDVNSSDIDITVSSSTPFTVPKDSANSNYESSMARIEISNVKSTAFEHSQPLLPTSSNAGNNMQFDDINLPELENYRQIYENSSTSKKKKRPCSKVKPKVLTNPPQSTAFSYPPQVLLQQVPTSFVPTPLLPQGMGLPQLSRGMPLPILHAYPPSIQIPSPTFVMPKNALLANSAVQTKVDSTVRDSYEKKQDDEVIEPASKRQKNASSGNGKSVVTKSSEKMDDILNPSSLQHKIRDAMIKASEDEEDCDKPLATLVGHPNDKVLRQQICEIVEKSDLQEVTINGVIQKIFGMYPKYDLNYRKDFMKSVIRSLLYRLGEEHGTKEELNQSSFSPDCSVSTTNPRDSPQPNKESSMDASTKSWNNLSSSQSEQQNC